MQARQFLKLTGIFIALTAGSTGCALGAGISARAAEPVLAMQRAMSPRALPTAPAQAAHTAFVGAGVAASAFAVNALSWTSQQVSGSDSVARDWFGNAVAMSGSMAIVGASEASVNGNDQQGAVYVFTNQNGVWTQTAKLVASDGQAQDFFGYSVALNGNTALIGAWDHYSGRVDGSAYVFTRSNGTWTQVAKLLPFGEDDADSWFGYAVALAGPDMALVGAPNAEDSNDDYIVGAVYAYRNTNGTWTQTQKFWGAQTTGAEHFGNAVAASGSTALIGEYHGGEGTYTGAAYIFKLENNTWMQEQRLLPDDADDYDYFGSAVALDGSTALIASGGSVINGGNASGAVYIFNKINGTWTQKQKLHGPQGPSSQEGGIGFGHWLALDGSRALIGAPYDSVDTSKNDGEGAAYLFTESACAWSQNHRFSLGTTAVYEDDFGIGVALAGHTALIGAQGRRGATGNVSQGAAYFFTNDDDTIFADGFDGNACP